MLLFSLILSVEWKSWMIPICVSHETTVKCQVWSHLETQFIDIQAAFSILFIKYNAFLRCSPPQTMAWTFYVAVHGYNRQKAEAYRPTESNVWNWKGTTSAIFPWPEPTRVQSRFGLQQTTWSRGQDTARNQLGNYTLAVNIRPKSITLRNLSLVLPTCYLLPRTLTHSVGLNLMQSRIV